MPGVIEVLVLGVIEVVVLDVIEVLGLCALEVLVPGAIVLTNANLRLT